MWITPLLHISMNATGLHKYVNIFIATHPTQQKKAAQLLKRIALDYFVQNNDIPTPLKTNTKPINRFLNSQNYLVFQWVECPPPKVG